VRARALALGFDVVGFARADEPLGIEHERYADFIARGMHGEMGYLAEHAEVRRTLDGAGIMEGARSVICVGRRYARPAAADAEDPPLARGIARYARGQDYHNHVHKKLRRLAAYLRTLAQGARARPLCDAVPVLERAWAARAGLGFIGKNGLMITPGQGSYQLLGEVVTNLVLTPGTPIEERCGSCTRCLDACPTSAFEAPFVLDPRRCLAYVTIEARGEPTPSVAEAAGEHLFGCDVCQEVCPFNKAATPAVDPRPFAPLPRWGGMGLAELARLDDAGFVRTTEGSPLRRAGRAGLARNAVLVAASRLARGSRGEAAPDRLQAEAAEVIAVGLAHDDPMVREVTAAAVRRIEGGSVEPSGGCPATGPGVTGLTTEPAPPGQPGGRNDAA
jgi:epoxyqueuosine reductase